MRRILRSRVCECVQAKNILVFMCVSACMQKEYSSLVCVSVCMQRMFKAFGCVNHRVVVTLVTDSVQRQWLIGSRKVDRKPRKLPH